MLNQTYQNQNHQNLSNPIYQSNQIYQNHHQNHQNQYKRYCHPDFPELEVLEDASGNKAYFISVKKLPEALKEIFKTVENLKELQKISSYPLHSKYC